jgi:hypothetical protein
VATRIARAKKATAKLLGRGVETQPVKLSGRKIAASFWGKGWCDHMDSFHDFENRLPRGRSYVRNGSVVHLELSKGKIRALVAGSEIYEVNLGVKLLDPARWDRIKRQCAGRISSLLDLLKGRLSDGVMRVVASREDGLFPDPGELEMSCSCPDIANMCKHVAAVIYGVGARLDQRPELLFLLRGVDHAELAAGGGVDSVIAKGAGGAAPLTGADLSEMFGIEMIASEKSAAAPAPGGARVGAAAGKPPGRAKPAVAAKARKGKGPAKPGTGAGRRGKGGKRTVSAAARAGEAAIAAGAPSGRKRPADAVKGKGGPAKPEAGIRKREPAAARKKPAGSPSRPATPPAARREAPPKPERRPGAGKKSGGPPAGKTGPAPGRAAGGKPARRPGSAK